MGIHPGNSDAGRHIVQFGLERTGTTLLKWMVEHNMPGVDVETSTAPWKHGPFCEDLLAEVEALRHVVVSIRHPLSFLVSYYDMLNTRTPHLETGSFPQWVRTTAKAYPHALRMWSFAYGYWCWRIGSGLHGDVVVVRLEDMLARPRDEIHRIGHIYGLPVQEGIELPTSYVAPGFGKPRLGQTFTEVRRRVVEDEEWRGHYTAELAEYAWSHIDRDVASSYGYYQEKDKWQAEPKTHAQ